MTGSPLPELILYTRDGCGLCDETRALVQGLLEDRAARGGRTAALRERDIAVHPELEATLRGLIPVLELGGRRLELATSPSRIRRFLADTLDGTLA